MRPYLGVLEQGLGLARGCEEAADIVGLEVDGLLILRQSDLLSDLLTTGQQVFELRLDISSELPVQGASMSVLDTSQYTCMLSMKNEQMNLTNAKSTVETKCLIYTHPFFK